MADKKKDRLCVGDLVQFRSGKDQVRTGIVTRVSGDTCMLLIHGKTLEIHRVAELVKTGHAPMLTRLLEEVE